MRQAPVLNYGQAERMALAHRLVDLTPNAAFSGKALPRPLYARPNFPGPLRL